jgi:hypothetical protein
MTTNKSVVAVDSSDSKTLGNDSFGVIVMWSLKSNVNIEGLTAAWAAEGLAEDWLIELPTKATAFSRAAKGLASNDRLVRRTSKGFGIVTEHRSNGTGRERLQHRHHITLHLNEVGVVDAECDPGFETDAEYLKNKCDTDFWNHLSHLSSNDLGGWLVSLVTDKCDGVVLRKAGGVYFVPPTRTALWEKIEKAFETGTGCTIDSIPAMSSDSAVEAVFNAIVRTAERHTEDILADVTEKKLGHRALETKIQSTISIKDKVAKYESLLGRQLTEVQDRLGKLQAALSVGMLSAQGGSETPFEGVDLTDI